MKVCATCHSEDVEEPLRIWVSANIWPHEASREGNDGFIEPIDTYCNNCKESSVKLIDKEIANAS